MRSLNRRDFLRSSAGAAALLGTGLDGRANQAGAGDRLNIAVIGVNGRGKEHVRGLAGKFNCVVSHICDTDSAVVGPAMQDARRRQGSEPRYVKDLRRIMDDPTIHAVSIATPNHWHALAAIWAMQAGKDVYVEKPVSPNVSEGRRIVEAARRHNKICQAGTQVRSMPGIREAIAFLQSGQLGQLQVARALCYKRRPSIAQIGAAGGRIPSTLDYDVWCGPAARQEPLRRTRLHYDWHWVWEYGNGDLGNQGIHQMDVARWGIGKSELARSCISAGGRVGYVDDGETANTQIAVFDYGTAKLIFEVRGLETSAYRGAKVGNVFHCTEGTLVFPSYSDGIAFDKAGNEIRRFRGTGDHFENFIQAVRSRRRQDLHGEIEEGHLSSALCHLANISYRLGQPAPLRNGMIGDDADTNETLSRTMEHLRANMVAVEGAQFRAGRRLTIDVRNENFGTDQEANRMLTREYRSGFEVPTRI
jgi:predicted dehydrogenase